MAAGVAALIGGVTCAVAIGGADPYGPGIIGLFLLVAVAPGLLLLAGILYLVGAFVGPRR